MDFVRSYLLTHEPTAMMISECELTRSDEINSAFFYVPGYLLIHSNSRAKFKNEKLKSRLCAYVRADVEFSRNEGLEGLNEMIVLDVQRKWRIIGVYRPFKLLDGETESSNFDRLVDSLKKASLTQGLDVYCLGDFNVDWAKESSFKGTLQAWSYDADLVQLIQNITRYRCVNTKDGIRAESGVLDHVYAPAILQDDTIITQTDTYLSDHEIISVRLSSSRIYRKSMKNTKVVIRDWRTYTPEKLHHLLALENQITIESLESAFESLVPKRVVRFKPEYGEIVNAKVAKLRKKRDRHLKWYKKWDSPRQLLLAKKATKSMIKCIKKEKLRVVNKKLESPNPKSFWSVVNQMLGKRFFDKKLELKTQNGIITDSSELSDIFANFFKDKVINLAQTMPGRPMAAGHGPPVPATFSLQDLEKALKKVKSKHCFGIDGVPLRIAKDFCLLMPNIALGFFNRMSVSGLTDDERTARIIPLHKKGSKTDVANYRPIANLCSMTKIYEKMLLDKLIIETEGLEGLYQHGFRSGHSTTTALLRLQDLIARHLDGGKLCLVYSVDLSAAFDLLRPDKFMTIMNEHLSHGLASSIANFLDKRRIVCDVNGTLSDTYDLPIGCVQGSILGPRLFTLYMGGLAAAIEVEDLVGYADDTYVVIPGESHEDIRAKLAVISKKHVSYLKSLGMVVNSSKTEIVLFGAEENVEFDFDDIIISSSNCIKALGITISRDLSWNQHVQTTISKSQSKLSLLRKIRRWLSMENFLKIATSQIFSTTYYAAPVWLNTTMGYKMWKRIESFHYRVMRVACNDFKGNKKRKVIDSLCKRATPKM